MKSIKRNALVVAMMFATVAALANGPLKNGMEKKVVKVELDPVFKKKDGKLFLNLLNLDQEKVTIKVLDSEGRVVFIESFDGELIIEKAFNFEKAFENEYTVIVNDNGKTYTETVAVK